MFLDDSVAHVSDRHRIYQVQSPIVAGSAFSNVRPGFGGSICGVSEAPLLCPLGLQ